MADPELYAVNTGDWDYEYSAMLRLERPGESYPSLCPCYLLEHPGGLVLVDAGISHDLVADPAAYGPHGAPGFEEVAGDDVDVAGHGSAAEQVRSLGYDPAAVELVILTHLHVDHAGDVTEFPEAEILVQEDELAYAWWPTDPVQRRLYAVGDFGPLRSPDVDVRALDGRVDVFGDGTVECIPTPGHTPGHQSVMVDLPDSGAVLLAGDVAFVESALDSERQPPFAWDTRAAIRSVRAVRDLARREDARVVLSHDREHFEGLPDPPAALR